MNTEPAIREFRGYLMSQAWGWTRPP